MLGKLRYHAFWFVDYFKRNNIKRNYNEIKFLNENLNSKEASDILEGYRRNLINHAIETTNFYKKSKITDFYKLPVINKSIIRDNFSDFESELYRRKFKYKVSTSGSTGTPFVTYLNKNKRLRNSADTIYFAEKSGFSVGDRLFYIRLWDDQHKKKSITSWILNIVSHNISDLRDEDIRTLLKKMERVPSRKGLLAYASVYDVICQYIERTKYVPKIKKLTSVIAISERLSDYAKQSMKKHFDVEVLSRYSASETGILAQQMPGSTNFEINWASYFVEILNLDNDEPVENGSIGRIVITDLFNYCVPMLRYDTGDLGIMKENDNGRLVLTNVEGRRMDMLYDTKGNMVSSHIIHQVCLFPGIIQYQLIQEGEKEYLFKVNATNKFTKTNQNHLIEKYKGYFGSDANVKIEFVDDIPILSSGKRKKVINKFIKQ